MGIALTDDHRELAEVARAFLTTQQARGAARSLLDSPSEARPPFWQELAGLGWLGLHVDEEYGGSSYGLPELVVVIEELGRAVAPGGFAWAVPANGHGCRVGLVCQGRPRPLLRRLARHGGHLRLW
jgi:alkylation response protein AidB-like acyl-CoA dehydrogenase